MSQIGAVNPEVTLGLTGHVTSRQGIPPSDEPIAGIVTVEPKSMSFNPREAASFPTRQLNSSTIAFGEVDYDREPT